MQKSLTKIRCHLSQLFIFIGLVMIITACSSKQTPDELTARGQKSYEAGNYQAAIIDLKTSLQIDPDNTEARHSLGRVYVQIGNYAAAEKELKAALSGNTPRPGAVLDLAQILLFLHRFPEVSALASNGLNNEQQASLISTKASAALRSENPTSALVLLEEAKQLAPDAPTVRVALARYTFKQSLPLYDDARRQIEQVLNDHPNNVDALLLLGDIESKSENWDAAYLLYSKALEISPGNQVALADRAQLAVRQSKFQEARKDLAALGPWSANSPGVAFLQGIMAFSEKDFDSAQAFLELAERAEQSYPTSLLFLAQIHYGAAHMERAERYANHYLTLQPESFHARKLLASIKFALEDYSAVEELLLPVVAFLDEDTEAIELLSKALINQGKVDEAVELLAALVELQPESAFALLQLGAGQTAQNDTSSAIENLELALELSPELDQVRVVHILLLLKNRDLDGADSAAREYVKIKPSVTAYNLLGRVHHTRGEEQQGEAAFMRAWELDKGNGYTARILSQYALNRGETAKAREFQQELLEQKNSHLGALMALAKIDALEGNEVLMIQHLELAVEKNPAAVDPRLVLARHLVSQGKIDKASSLLQPMENGQSVIPQVLQISSLIDIIRHDYKSAEEKLVELTSIRPSDSYPHYLLAYAYSGLGQPKKTIDELKLSVSLDPEAALPRVTLVKLLLIQGKNTEAREQADQLTKMAPAHPVIMELQGKVNAAQGNYETAEQNFSDAFVLQPATDRVMQLASVKHKQGDTRGAIETLASWVADHPGDDGVRLLLSQYLSESGNEAGARQQLDVLVAKEPAKLAALNNLAWMLRQSESGKAVEYAKRASKWAPDSAEILDTLAMSYFFNEQYDLAQSTINQARILAPQQPSLIIHYATITGKMGNTKAAIQALEQLLHREKSFPERTDAQKLLAALQK